MARLCEQLPSLILDGNFERAFFCLFLFFGGLLDSFSGAIYFYACLISFDSFDQLGHAKAWNTPKNDQKWQWTIHFSYFTYFAILFAAIGTRANL